METQPFERGLRSIAAFAGEILWPKRLDGTIGRLVGALSLLALGRAAFDFGLSAAAVEIFHYYDMVLRAALGWIDPYIQLLVDNISVSLSLHLVFNDYWHHVYVVLQMLFVRDAGVAFADGRRGLGVTRLAVGFVIASSTAILTALQFPGLADWAENLLFATLPTAAIFAYDVVMYFHAAYRRLEELNVVDGSPDRTRGAFLGRALRRGTNRFLLGLAVTYGCFLIPAVWNARPPAGGLVAIAVATVANASYWIWRGSTYARARVTDGQDWISSFRESEAGRFGVAVAGVLVWAAILAGLNVQALQLGI